MKIESSKKPWEVNRTRADGHAARGKKRFLIFARL
jgi:hypothetical protein